MTLLLDLENVSYDIPVSITNRRMGSDTYAEATFSIDESRYVAGRQSLWPSLLIVRTGHFVTAHVCNL
jgi:hypothetical protein